MAEIMAGGWDSERAPIGVDPCGSRGGGRLGAGGLDRGDDVVVVRRYLEALTHEGAVEPVVRERFITVAARYSLRLDVGVRAWRTVGVPEPDLRAAGLVC